MYFTTSQLASRHTPTSTTTETRTTTMTAMIRTEDATPDGLKAAQECAPTFSTRLSTFPFLFFLFYFVYFHTTTMTAMVMTATAAAAAATMAVATTTAATTPSLKRQWPAPTPNGMNGRQTVADRVG